MMGEKTPEVTGKPTYLKIIDTDRLLRFMAFCGIELDSHWTEEAGWVCTWKCYNGKTYQTSDDRSLNLALRACLLKAHEDDAFGSLEEKM